jgi:hypothetical protein
VTEELEEMRLKVVLAWEDWILAMRGAGYSEDEVKAECTKAKDRAIQKIRDMVAARHLN